MGFQNMIRAVLLLMVIQLHCETPLAAKALQSSVQSHTKPTKHSGDSAIDLDSLEPLSDLNALPYVITVPRRKPQTPSSPRKRQLRANDGSDPDNSAQYADPLPSSLSVSKEKRKKQSDDAADLESSRHYVDPSPYVLTVPNRKSQAAPSKSRRRQVYPDDATELDGLQHYADPSSYIITAPTRKPQTSPVSKSRGHQEHSDDTESNSFRRYADPSYIITSDHKPYASDSHGYQVHSVDAANLDNLRRYIITERRPNVKSSPPKPRVYSNDVPGEYSNGMSSDEYLNDVPEEYSDDVSNQRSDATPSTAYAMDSAQPARRSNSLSNLANIGIRGINAIPKVLLGDEDDDEKPRRSRYEEVETIVKCP